MRRATWKMAIVRKVFPGHDGLVGNAEIQSCDGSYIRPISNLVLLMSKGEDEQFKLT